jgi:hypothetical protein
MQNLRQKLIIYFSIFMIGSLLLSACNMPRKGDVTPEGPGAVNTAAAETVAAKLTQTSGAPVVETETPTATESPTNTPLPTATATFTQVPPTKTPIPCDRVEFVKDVSYPDNTEVAPGEVFIKTWRLKNAGACTWSPEYALVFTGGESMGTPAAVPVPGYVAPGQTVDVSVTLTAPLTGGTYRGDYKLRNASNEVFGLGASNKSFYVQVKVNLPSGLTFDFVTEAEFADWESGEGGTADTNLTFGGTNDDPDGVAKILNSVVLENGALSSKILYTHPKHASDGFVAGYFPSYTVQNGDRFKTRLGFALTCGSGKVKFRLLYKEGATLTKIVDWTKTCNGNLMVVEQDLSSLKGKTVQFVLAVLADGTYTDDRAIWSSPRIERP